MLRDNLVELIEPMRNSAGTDLLALGIYQQPASDDSLSCLENPRPEGAESSLTDNVTSPFPAEPKQFVEGLYVEKKTRLIAEFVTFYVKLLDEISENLKLLSRFESPLNPLILEEFQKYISQASVEPYAIKRRNLFLE